MTTIEIEELVIGLLFLLGIWIAFGEAGE